MTIEIARKPLRKRVFLQTAKRYAYPIRTAVRSLVTNTYYRILRLVKPPRIPANQDGKVLIHLGCGFQDDPRFINVDATPFPHVHYVSAVERLPMFPDNSADLIYACHVLEHVSHTEVTGVLEDWYRVLKPGGIARISVPDFEKLIEIYTSEGGAIEPILSPLMGAQDTEHGFHMSIFDEAYLTKLLKTANFREVQPWDPKTAEYYTFNDWAQKLVHSKYAVSLNLEAVK